MGLFGNTSSKKSNKFLIFLVEDNLIYARQLEFFIKSKFEGKVEVDYSPVAEVVEIKIKNGQIPDLIIMDHYLNARYEDAENGFDMLKKLKQKYPSIYFIFHSSQESIELALSVINDNICSYIEKGENAFKRIENELKKHIK